MLSLNAAKPGSHYARFSCNLEGSPVRPVGHISIHDQRECHIRQLRTAAKPGSPLRAVFAQWGGKPGAEPP